MRGSPGLREHLGNEDDPGGGVDASVRPAGGSACDPLQQGGLARPVGPRDEEVLAVAHLEGGRREASLHRRAADGQGDTHCVWVR